MKILLRGLLVAVLFGGISSLARESVEPNVGLHRYTPRTHALINAKVVTRPGEVLEEATIIVRDGLIEAVGQNVEAPDDARIWDLSGKIVYAGFIDAYSHFGMPNGLKPFIRKPPEPGSPPQKEPPTPDQTGASYWNSYVTPERLAESYYDGKKRLADKLSDLGFTSVATFPGRGIFRGQGALVNLNGKSINEAAVRLSVAQHIAFEQASWRSGDYPSSLMGAIALIRQAFYDGQWLEDSKAAYLQNTDKLERPESNAALDALAQLLSGDHFALFHAGDELDYQRFHRIAEEFDLDFAILGNGYEYRRASILKDMGKTVILPLAFPKTPRVEREDTALDISLEQLQHWELAPSNAAFLEKNGVSFCLSSHFLGDPAKEFWSALRKAIKRGLSAETALASLTTNPASLYAVSDQLGSIEAGKIANLVVSTGDLFADEKAKVALVWIDGDPVEKKPWEAPELTGEWRFAWQGVEAFEKGEFKTEGSKVSLKADDASISGTIDKREVLLFLPDTILGGEDESAVARLRADLTEGMLAGSGVLPSGERFAWSAKRVKGEGEDDEEEEEGEEEGDGEEESIPTLEFERYPAGAYGVSELEQPSAILVKDATIWTSGPDGVLQEADLLVRDGKVSKLGKNLRPPRGAVVIDAAGKHVTPGLIDCHSHIAGSRGVNEGASAISVEVRIGDIINPVDINIYRQLAGGLTTSNILHGSANPMGGQNQVIKLRWGDDAEGLKFKGAKPGVKFALGENVKQSNWGDNFTGRYPQTRMGVGQFMISNFRAAEDYERRWEDFNAGRTLMPPRKNLRMDATLEILKGERSVHIHSYRQDEILAFARLAGRFNLDVAAFQHILEGYKVADALVEIDAGGSSFSDWWAYKFEVYDAIPYNGALMHEAGVVVSYNSDDAELATRMNTEAAKAVKYGGLSEEVALKFVTLNPAIQLRVHDRVGSLEKGKDADFVIWNEHPLSTYAYAEQTWIDGVKRFDKIENRERFEADLKEREQLVQKALKARLKELKMATKSKKLDKEEEYGAPPGNDPNDPEWIYHDGMIHYSCSGLEEGGYHVH